MGFNGIYPMVLLIIIPMKNGYFIGNINPTFPDKPIFVVVLRCGPAWQDSHSVVLPKSRGPGQEAQPFHFDGQATRLEKLRRDGDRVHRCTHFLCQVQDIPRFADDFRSHLSSWGNVFLRFGGTD